MFEALYVVDLTSYQPNDSDGLNCSHQEPQKGPWTLCLHSSPNSVHLGLHDYMWVLSRLFVENITQSFLSVMLLLALGRIIRHSAQGRSASMAVQHSSLPLL